MSYWIDSHSHLSDKGFRSDPEGYLNRVKENNVGRILAISCNKEDWLWNISLAQKYDFIDVAVGYYPGDVRELNENSFDELVKMAKDEKVIAIGEIGLDYYWDDSFKDLQKDWFIKQIKLANELNKPISIHCRDAYEDTYQILKENPCEKVLMHCYSGSKEMAIQFMTLPIDFRFAFGGTLTYKNNVKGKECALYLPIDRIMLETDSPYLTPQIYRGQKNESKNVRYVGEYMAELKGISIDILQDQFKKNYEEFFGVKCD